MRLWKRTFSVKLRKIHRYAGRASTAPAETTGVKTLGPRLEQSTGPHCAETREIVKQRPNKFSHPPNLPEKTRRAGGPPAHPPQQIARSPAPTRQAHIPFQHRSSSCFANSLVRTPTSGPESWNPRSLPSATNTNGPDTGAANPSRVDFVKIRLFRRAFHDKGPPTQPQTPNQLHRTTSSSPVTPDPLFPPPGTPFSQELRGNPTEPIQIR